MVGGFGFENGFALGVTVRLRWKITPAVGWSCSVGMAVVAVGKLQVWPYRRPGLNESPLSVGSKNLRSELGFRDSGLDSS